MTLKLGKMSASSKILRCTGSWVTQILKILFAQKNLENLPVGGYHAMTPNSYNKNISAG